MGLCELTKTLLLGAITTCPLGLFTLVWPVACSRRAAEQSWEVLLVEG